MKRVYTISIFLMLFSIKTFAQNTPDHWETAVYDHSIWKYCLGTSDPGSLWKNPDFNDSTWASGKGGFGFGDGDDSTLIENVPSIFIRHTFQIADTSKIISGIIHVDYDDGFIAYLNGVEIARANIASTTPVYNEYTGTSHEALLFSGGTPEGFWMNKSSIQNILKNGDNTLSIEVHNANGTSTDLTVRAFLSFGISDKSTDFGAVPSWFTTSKILESSNLPLVIVNTNGQWIYDEPKIKAHMGIIDNGPGARNNSTDAFNNYDGPIGIEMKGESSANFPKNSYLFETHNILEEDTSVSLLGMPQESDWILYAPYTDKTMIRDVLTYQLGREMGQYASRTRFCELIINDDYKGIYVLMERIKRDSNRVNIAKLTPTDTVGKALTGGYILRVDKIDNNDFPAWRSNASPQLPNEPVINFQFYYPEGDELHVKQKDYIQYYIREFESALSSSNFKDTYKNYIDVSSFVDYMLITELCKNIDGYIYSTYMYKEKESKGGKLKMGPLWDYNLAFGNVDYLANSQYAPGWTYNDNYRMYWFRRLMTDPTFSNQFSCRWADLRNTVFSTEHINQWIDSTANVLSEAQERNFKRWPILGVYVWPNQFIGNTYQEEIDFLKDWINKRIEWVDNNLPKTCLPTAIEEDLEDGTIVYPNPSLFSFNFEFKRPLTNANLQIFSSTGELLFSKLISGSRFSWEGVLNTGAKVSQGIYLFKITDGKKISNTGKLIKN